MKKLNKWMEKWATITMLVMFVALLITTLMCVYG